MTSLDKYRLLDFDQMINGFDDMMREMADKGIDFNVAAFWMEIQAGDRFELTSENNVTAECEVHGDANHFLIDSKGGGIRCRECLIDLLEDMQTYYDHPELLTMEKDAKLINRIAYFSCRFVN